MPSPIAKANTYYHGIHFWWKNCRLSHLPMWTRHGSNHIQCIMLIPHWTDEANTRTWQPRHVLREGTLSLCVRVRRLVRLAMHSYRFKIETSHISFDAGLELPLLLLPFSVVFPLTRAHFNMDISTLSFVRKYLQREEWESVRSLFWVSILVTT